MLDTEDNTGLVPPWTVDDRETVQGCVAVVGEGAGGEGRGGCS